MAHGMKLSNSYQRAFGYKLYEATPKSVFAAVAYSMCFIDQEEAGTDEAVARFLHEWDMLYQNGIVPQKPPRV